MTEHSSLPWRGRGVDASIRNAPADAGLELVRVLGQERLEVITELAEWQESLIIYLSRAAKRQIERECP